MDKQEFSDKLQEIADGIEKIAEGLEESEYKAAASQEKVASQESTAEFGFGETSSKPSKGSNPLLEFCLS